MGERPERDGSHGFEFQLLTPLLLGLLVPFLAASYFDLELLRPIRWPLWLFLCLLFLLCTVLFFYSHHFPGRISSIAVNRQARTMEIRWRNLMATASQIVPFGDVSALRVRTAYDDDGYPTRVAELVLRSHPPIELPSNVTDAELKPLRAAIGLG